MNRPDLFTGPDVGLAAVLAARETRVRRRQEVLAGARWPVVSVLPVMPGPIKDCAASRALQDAALAALPELCAQRGWPMRLLWKETPPTGPEALLAVETDAVDLKAAVIELEESHPLGRLFDLDVVDPRQGSLSRRDLGRSPRRCLICGEPAHVCARAQAHSLEALFEAMEARIDAARVRSV